MGLVDYASSSSDESSTAADDYDKAPAKRRKLTNEPSEVSSAPPLPSAFHDLYSAPARVSSSDDPTLHGGRKRIVPHVEGNWAAHVYLEWHPSPAAHALLSSLLDSISRSSASTGFKSLLTSENLVPLPLHVSLSAPLVLRSEVKDAFHAELLASLQSAVRELHPQARKTGRLTLQAEGLDWFVNKEGTRRFLVLRMGAAEEDGGALMRLLHAANGVARRFGCPELYADSGTVPHDVDGDAAKVSNVREIRGRGEGDTVKKGEKGGSGKDGSFHISFAWSLNLEAGEEWKRDGAVQEAMDEMKAQDIVFKDIKVKMGRDVTSVPFGRT